MKRVHGSEGVVIRELVWGYVHCDDIDPMYGQYEYCI